MPIHDWTRVGANRFHHFHQDWTIEIARQLNRGVLPNGYSALAEQVTGGPEPDVVTLSVPRQGDAELTGGLALAESPISTTFQSQTEVSRYARRANRVVVYHPDGDVVAVIELVSPGNKAGRHALDAFTRKAAQYLHAGIHLLVVDLFPPSKRDPQGIHKAIWDRIQDEPFALPADKQRTVAAYCAGGMLRAFVEPLGVGDVMPEMPVFLTTDRYVPCPLERTYQTSWEMFPRSLKGELVDS